MFDPALLDLPVYAPWSRLTIRRCLLAVAWIVCFYAAWQRLDNAVHMFDRTDRPPSTVWGWENGKGNCGHTQIDFGGQWLMGRMVATGQGRHLYDRNHHWKALHDGYPRERNAKLAREQSFPAKDRPSGDHTEEHFRTDAENLMAWTMGGVNDSKRWGDAGRGLGCAFAGGANGNPFTAAASQKLVGEIVDAELIAELDRPSVGGPLYPPVHGLFYAPLGLISDAQAAYSAFQILSIVACFFSGWVAQWMSRGRLAWPLCTAMILAYPGFRPGLDLGQNHAISLAILLLGWALVARGRQYAGGAVWGLLAFKPVWGITFVLVPLLMLRWRIVLAMGLVGCSLALATLPIVGLDAWFQWLEVGKEATATYNTSKNWIGLSRDLAGIPKRILLDFDKPESERADPFAERLGWVLWAVVFTGTVANYCLRGNRRPTGLGAGFLFLGAYHCCYRFMYYDVLLSAMAVFALFADPGLIFRTAQFRLVEDEIDPFARKARLYASSFPVFIVALLLLNDNWLMSVRPVATIGADYFAVATTTPDGKGAPRTPTLSATTDYFHPVDTVLLLVLWAWAGLRLLRDGDSPPSTARPGSVAAGLVT